MTNNTNATKREALSAAGLLWITTDETTSRAAPEEFCGAVWQKQLRDVTERAKQQEGITLDDRSAFIAHISSYHLGGVRLVRLLQPVTQHPTRQIFAPPARCSPI